MAVDVRKGQGDVKLTREEFERRLRERFYDPAFDDGRAPDRGRDRGRVEGLRRVPQEPAHAEGRTRVSPIRISSCRSNGSRRASAFTTPQRQQNDASRGSRVLLVCGAARHDQTCPGEMSKTFRLASLAREEIERAGVECDLLDLSLLTAQYGRQILPCKACVSTAMPLCHWPCSCYPNHAMGQVNDWMNELYPRWVAAHGVMIVTPVYWYQAPSVLKLMIDRLVCADGGNPDPTTTRGKDVKEAKALELAGWHYPRHLAGRVFAVVVHGDAAGAETLRRSLSDWLCDMELVPAMRRGRHRSLHRLLRAVRDEPRGARSKTRPCSRRSATRRRPSSTPSLSIAPADSRSGTRRRSATEVERTVVSASRRDSKRSQCVSLESRFSAR